MNGGVQDDVKDKPLEIDGFQPIHTNNFDFVQNIDSTIYSRVS